MRGCRKGKTGISITGLSALAELAFYFQEPAEIEHGSVWIVE